MRPLLLVVATCALGCRGATVTVRNHSSERLQDVVIVATDVSGSIESIDAGGERWMSVCPHGEAGSIDVSFRANGRGYQYRQLPVYFECDVLYDVRVDVSPELSATAIATLK